MSTPPSPTQVMLSPDRQVGDVPVDRVPDAVKAGFKMGVEMVSPDGTEGVIPVDRAHDAMQNGFTLKAPTGQLQQSGFLGDVWQGAKDAASDVWDKISNSDPSQVALASATGGISTAFSNLAPHIGTIKAYEDARASGKGILESLVQAEKQAQSQSDVAQMVQKSTAAFKNNPTAATVRGVVDAATAAASVFGLTRTGGPTPDVALAPVDAPVLPEESLEAPLTPDEVQAASPTPPKQPNVVRRAVSAVANSPAVKGEAVAQGPADTALRQGAQAAAGDEEAQIASTATANPSLRTVLEEPTDALEASAKAAYRQIDEAAGTDFKALNEKLDNTEYQIRQLTDTEADQALEAKLEASRQGLIDKIAQAKQDAIDNGVDPDLLDKADAQFTQARALKDLDAKVFKNPNIIVGNTKFGTNETVNVNSAINALQKLQDNTKFGAPRLEQALGEDGADKLLQDMYAAQRQGVKAMSRQQFAFKVAKYIGYGAAATIGGAGVRAVLSGRE